MQRYSYPAFHTVTGQQDVFSALSKVCVHPIQPLTEQGCLVTSTFGRTATHFIASTDGDDLEPIPLADHDRAPVPGCRSQFATAQVLQGSPFAHQVTPSPIASPYTASSDQMGDTFQGGQPAYVPHQILDSILTSPDIVSSSTHSFNFGQPATHFIASTDYDDLEPTPLADHTQAPVPGCQSQFSTVQVLH